MRSCTQSWPESFGPSGQSVLTSTRQTSHEGPRELIYSARVGKAQPQHPDAQGSVMCRSVRRGKHDQVPFWRDNRLGRKRQSSRPTR